MSSLEIAPITVKPNTANDEIKYCYCLICCSSVALCGHDNGAMPRITNPPRRERCVVCVDLYYAPCPTCGAAPGPDSGDPPP